jgi:hypothetical protein
MTRFDEDDLPEELREIAERLRAERPRLTEVEMDQIKVRAMANAAKDEAPRGRRSRRVPMRSRLLVLALATALIGATTAGGFAAGGGGATPNAATAQYCKQNPDKKKCP